MNVKYWACFLVVTLSANYVSAFFLGGHHRSRRGNYDGWNTCNKRLHGYLSSNLDGIRRSVHSKYGGHCSLGDRKWNDYTLRNLRARGFGDFAFGDTCNYHVEDGQAFIRFALTFEKIIASFALVIPEAAGGILEKFADAIFGIIGYFVDKFLQVVFPPFLCDVVLVGDYDRGFRLSKFDILKSEGDIGFLGGLAGHADALHSFKSILFEPLEYAIRLFLTSHFKPILARGIGNWECNKSLFSRWGLDLGHGGRYGGSRLEGEEEEEKSEEEVSEDIGLEERESGRGRKTGGYESGGKSGWGERGVIGGKSGRKSRGSGSGRVSGHGGRHGKSGLRKRTWGSEDGGKSGLGEREGSHFGGKSRRKSRGSGSGKVSGHGGRHGKSGLRKRTRGSEDGGKSGYSKIGSGSGRKSGLRKGTRRSGQGGRKGGWSYSRTGGSESDEESDTEESDIEESDTEESVTEESDTEESYTEESDTEESDTEESDTEESSSEESGDANSGYQDSSKYSYTYTYDENEE